MLATLILDIIIFNAIDKNEKWGKIASITLSIAIICAGISLYLS